ncbi:MAG: NAD-dependent epimerase/dehydratase family protein [Muribaculaceae bacterium]|nr:NAD-dependent epimerase/dehydratase family protein [Muribaculaceae bacterium]
MKKMLVTGGTVFVSRYVAEYYIKKEYHVYTLNRGHGIQPAGVTFLKADRHDLGDKLRSEYFDVILDVTAYTASDVNLLLDALGGFQDYILISSSAVYPEDCPQPFTEKTPTGANKFWGGYGMDKLAAERALLDRCPDAYILRPPYLYGPMNNLYREAFVFDYALQDRKFYLPGEGLMNLQFFHVHDLCRFMDILLSRKPGRHIFNVGNPESVSILDWVTLCYEAAGKRAEFVHVPTDIEQRNYFSFYNYAYHLDVREQTKLMPALTPLGEGLKESLAWYLAHPEGVKKKPYMEYINIHLQKNGPE